MFKFRDYQERIIEKGFKQIKERGWCYLSMEVRTGKTLTSLGIAEKVIKSGTPGKSVVFVTKKKAIGSIEKDCGLLNSSHMSIQIINYESLHKIDTSSVDVWILDEAHKLGQIGRPSQKTKLLKSVISKDAAVIFLSGTPTPENGSQIFHQMFVLGERSPFGKMNFYKWARENCKITQRMINGFMVKDYTNCHFDISTLNFLSYSQKDAGFKNEIMEHFLEVEMKPITKKIIKTLKKDKVYEGNDDVILADTAVKEMQKIHQLSSGTCILDGSEKAVIIDESKVLFIKKRFKSEKIAIFYKFKAELEMLKKHFDITQDIEEFNTSDKVIALQFVSGREGIKLDHADCIVAINIDFSATTYWQFRDRMTTIDSNEGHVYFIVSDCGIEREVYKAVQGKKNYTKRFYERTRLSEKNPEKSREGGVLRSKTNKDQQKRDTRHSGSEGQGNLFH